MTNSCIKGDFRVLVSWLKAKMQGFVIFRSFVCDIVCDNTVAHRIQTLQNTAVRIITFNGPRTSANPLLSDLEILNVFDQVKIMNIIYIHKYFNTNLPTESLQSLVFEKTQHLIETKDKVIELIFRPNVNTTNFGLNSLTGISTNQWNELQRNFDDKKLSELNLKYLKEISKKYYMSKYKQGWI